MEVFGDMLIAIMEFLRMPFTVWGVELTLLNILAGTTLFSIVVYVIRELVFGG